MSTSVAHKITGRVRTGDVMINENVDFERLLLSENVLAGLKSAGFERPSPIQLKAIPLGRCGLDLIVQAKSGTGKTCVFSVIALESVIIESSSTQVVALAPTREIAVQICEVIKSIGSGIKGLKCHTFIGGMPVSEDRVKLKKCHIAIATPGRLKQLIEDGILHTESIRMFILDEADKLLEENFQESINWIYSTLPENKQILALSATYPEVLAQHLTAYMRNPTFVRMNATDPALLGIRQYYKTVPFHPLPQKSLENKVNSLVDLLSSINFSQCLVFSNYQLRAQSLSDMLNKKGWPSAFISGAQDQQDRLTAMDKLKTLKCRVLVSTDLTARGIDAEHVNLVVNVDLPWDHETYLHRIGRAGRFGTYGAGITIVLEGKQLEEMRAIERKCNTTIKALPEPIPADLAKSSGYMSLNVDDLVTTEQIITVPKQEHEEKTKSQENGVQPESDKNEIEVKPKSKLGKQSSVLGSLLTNVVDYNKDKMLDHAKSDPKDFYSNGIKQNPIDTNSAKIYQNPNDTHSAKIYQNPMETHSAGIRQNHIKTHSAGGSWVNKRDGDKNQADGPRNPSLETLPIEPLVSGGFGDGYLPSLISPSDPQLEMELTEDFRREMGKYQQRSEKPKRCSWSYAEASRSLQEYLAEDDNDEKQRKPNNAQENTSMRNSKATEVDQKTQILNANKEVDQENGNWNGYSTELVESVRKLLDQVYLKYSTPMINGRLYGETALDNISSGVVQVSGNLHRRTVPVPNTVIASDVRERVSKYEISSAPVDVSGGVSSVPPADTQTQTKPNKAKTAAKKDPDGRRNMRPKTNTAVHGMCPNSNVQGTCANSKGNTDTSGNRNTDTSGNGYADDSTRDKEKTVEGKDRGYPLNQWESVVKKSSDSENEGELPEDRRAELLEELKECDKRLEKLRVTGEDAASSSDESEAENYDSEETDCFGSEEDDSGEECAGAYLNGVHDNQRSNGFQNPTGYYGYQSGHQVGHYGNAYGYEGGRQSGYYGNNDEGNYQEFAVHGNHPSNEWLSGSMPYWSNVHHQQPITGGGYPQPIPGGSYPQPIPGGGYPQPIQGGGYREYLAQCYSSAVMTTKYYCDMMKYYDQSANLSDHYSAQKQYIEKMSRRK